MDLGGRLLYRSGRNLSTPFLRARQPLVWSGVHGPRKKKAQKNARAAISRDLVGMKPTLLAAQHRALLPLTLILFISQSTGLKIGVEKAAYEPERGGEDMLICITDAD